MAGPSGLAVPPLRKVSATGEFKARFLHFWSHISLELEKGDTVEAGCWLRAGAEEEGRVMLDALRGRIAAVFGPAMADQSLDLADAGGQ